MTEQLRVINLSTFSGERVALLLANPLLMAQLDVEVALKLRELQFVRTAVRNISADNYMIHSNTIPHKEDPAHWLVALPPELAGKILK